MTEPRPISRSDVQDHAPPLFVLIRGNSGSGKSSVARRLREQVGRGTALVDQDHFRRRVLWEKDVEGAFAPTFICATVSYLLDQGWPVVLEGILHASRYRGALVELLARYPAHVYYLNVPFDETVRRHATRPQASEWGPEVMREWYVSHDVLGVDGETVVPASSSLEETVERILGDLSSPAPVLLP